MIIKSNLNSSFWTHIIVIIIINIVIIIYLWFNLFSYPGSTAKSAACNATTAWPDKKREGR